VRMHGGANQLANEDAKWTPQRRSKPKPFGGFVASPSFGREAASTAFLLEAIAVTEGADRLTVVRQAVEDRCDDGAVVEARLGPIAEARVRGGDDRAALLAAGDGLEGRRRLLGVPGRQADFVDDQQAFVLFARI
jgi:hypothetical protein